VLDAVAEFDQAYVSFSGGIDSTLVLSVAVAVARRAGLPEPIPVTLCFPSVNTAQEGEWQQRVVEALALREWERIVVDDQLDFVGPYAERHLTAHGVLFPPNVHFHAPMLDFARGGVLLTGLDGDGVLGSWKYGHLWTRRLNTYKGVVAAEALATTFARPLLRRKPRHDGYEWLVPEVRSRMLLRDAEERWDEPIVWRAREEWVAGRRYLNMAEHSLGLVAAASGAAVHHPLLDPRFIGALASLRPIRGWPNRATLVRDLFADHLPVPVFQRRTKATFDDAVYCDASKAVMARAGTDKLPPEVDGPRLVHVLRSGDAGPLGMLIQHLWLAER